MAILGTHPLPPISAEYSRLRDEQLERVARFARTVASPLLLLGDLNTSPWSDRFRSFLRESGLHDSALGRGLQATWPAGWWPFSIPIDHGLYSAGLAVLSRRVGSFVGSDHYPILAEVAVVSPTALRGDSSPPSASGLTKPAVPGT